MRSYMRSRAQALATTALAAAIASLAVPAFAANTVKLDISGTGQLNSLAIAQDPTNNTNSITTTGASSGGQIPVRGKWNSLSITQNGAGNSFASTGLTASTGSTSASLNLTYGSSATTGNNSHTLVIGDVTAPTNPAVTVNVSNTDATHDANTITDSLNGTSLTYNLAVAGTNNTIANTIAASGGVTLAVTANGGVDGSGNTITNTVTGATSANVSVAVNSNGNSVTNTSDGSGDKVIGVSLPSGGASGNTVVQDLTGGSGAQTANLTVTGVTSRVNYALTASGAGTTANITLADVVGASGAAGKVVISQTGAGDNLGLTFNGNGFTMGSGLAGGAGIVITQASPGANFSATFGAGSNGYQLSLSM